MIPFESSEAPDHNLELQTWPTILPKLKTFGAAPTLWNNPGTKFQASKFLQNQLGRCESEPEGPIVSRDEFRKEQVRRLGLGWHGAFVQTPQLPSSFRLLALCR